MNAKEAKEILANDKEEMKNFPLGAVWLRAQGYMEALRGDEVKELVETARHFKDHAAGTCSICEKMYEILARSAEVLNDKGARGDKEEPMTDEEQYAADFRHISGINPALLRVDKEVSGDEKGAGKGCEHQWIGPAIGGTHCKKCGAPVPR